MLPRSALTFLLALFLCPTLTRAQSNPPADADLTAPAHVSFVEGAVVLERDGKPDGSPLNMPLLSGDRLKTQDGRVEVLFADGSALHLDARSTLDVQSDDLVRLIDGRLRLSIAGPSRAVAYRIDSPAGSVRISQSGEYRVSMLRGEAETQLELAVIRGTGEIFTDEGTTTVRAGERAYASAGLMPSYAYSYNSANWDAFDRWSESRRDTRMGVSAQYLPEDVRPYSSTFDEYGDWRYQQTYGYVWYPRVAAGWRPYYYGRWASYPRYGWTWIGADAFSWPTHHYGRWGFSAGVWFWIPASRWAPAYVSWAYAPGYVSWCPLGFDNRPVISINIFGGGSRYYSSSYAWTAVPYSHFGSRYYVHQRAVNWDRWDRRTTWQAGRSAPLGGDIAVPRGSTTATPIRWAGRSEVGGRRPEVGIRPGVRDTTGFRSQPGSSSAAPRYVNRGDQIIRSQTERPSSPLPRGDLAGARTAPSPGAGRVPPSELRNAGPMRRTETPSGIAEIASPGRRGDTGGVERAVPRSAPRTFDDRGDAPAYALPGYRRPDMNGVRDDNVANPAPRSVDGGSRDLYRVRPTDRVYQPVPRSGGNEGAAAPAAPREYARPRGEAGGRPSGGYAPPPAASAPPPNSGFRQAPRPEPSREAPAPRAAPSNGGAESRATPRSAPAQGGGQARPRGGRGGV